MDARSLSPAPDAAAGETAREADLDALLLELAQGNPLTELIDLMRRTKGANAWTALRKEIARQSPQGHGPTLRALDTLIGYRYGDTPPEHVVDATVTAYWADGGRHYPPYNVCAHVAEHLPSVHEQHLRSLFNTLRERDPTLLYSAPSWASRSDRAALYGALWGEMKRAGLSARGLLALLRLARQMDESLFARTAHAVLALLMSGEDGPVRDTLCEAFATAILETGLDPALVPTTLCDALARAAQGEAPAPIIALQAEIDIAADRFGLARQRLQALMDDPGARENARALHRRIDALETLRALRRASPKRRRLGFDRLLAETLREADAGVPAALILEVATIAIETGRIAPELDRLAGGYPGGPRSLADALSSKILGELRGAPKTPGGTRDERIATAISILKHAGQGEAAYVISQLDDNAEHDSSAVALNAYFSGVMVGAGAAVADRTRDITRVYEGELAKVDWPASARGVPWPYAPPADAIPSLAAASAQPDRWPRISIVIPSFNQAPFVEETILSILNQSYPDVELIVFDGGSTDGTVDVLERYRDRLNVLVIEPDEGQSDALNKGFARATGEILHWLNTDDLLAPGALRAVGATFARTRADLIAGFCIEFAERRMGLLNLPQADEAFFTPHDLTNLFGRWLRGDFFYQPEVFFSRAIWERTGARLRTDAHYSMDFEFWVRCAQAGASYQRLPVPIAFFRKHADQKTDALVECIDEQAGIIARMGFSDPSPIRAERVRRDAQRFVRRGRRVAVVTRRFDKIFAPGAHAEAARADPRYDITFHDDPASVDAPASDLIIHLCHVLGDYADIEAYRSRGFRGLVLGWFWDNHHTYFENARTAAALDVACPSHLLFADYLRNRDAVQVETVPLCVTQWSARTAGTLFRQHRSQPRSDLVYGGFVRYAVGSARTDLVLSLLSQPAPSALYLLDESNLAPYFARTPADRFAEWCAHKVSLCLPVRDDLSQRFFDAWLTGQIPLVPKRLLPTLAFLGDDTLERHVAMFDEMTAESVLEAHQRALETFEAGGRAGIEERHALAREEHMFSNRVALLLDRVRELAS